MTGLILIIADDADLASALQPALEREAFRLCSERTGRGGLERCAAGPPPDLVLVDRVLPDMSGIELCKRLRRAEQTRRLPAIILSGSAGSRELEAGFRAGADDYVVKPFSVRELALRCRAILLRASGQR